MSQLLFAPFQRFVTDELETRRDDRIQLQKPKSPWMRMTSNFKPDNGNRKILMGGSLDLEDELKFGFQNLYNRESDTGELFRAEPTINSINVEEKMESLDCQVEWVANSIEQVEDLFPYFLNMGRTVVVDWGWSDMPENSTVNVADVDEVTEIFSQLEPEDRTEGGNTQRDQRERDLDFLTRYDHPKYEKLRKGEGRYSFIVGSIVDFNISAAEGGQYNCTTEIKHVSNTMIHTRARTQQSRRSETEQEGSSSRVRKTFYEFLQQRFELFLSDQWQASDTDQIVKDKDIVKVVSDSVIGGSVSRSDDSDTAGVFFISWGLLERLVNRHASLVSEENNVSTFKLDSGSSVISNYVEEGQNFQDGSPVNLRSLDPLVFLVAAGNRAASQNPQFRQLSDKSAVSEYFSDDFSINSGSEGFRRGFMHNIYMNHETVIEAFRLNENIFDALKYLLERVSAAAFEIWDFEMVADSNLIKIIDNNAVPDKTASQFLDDDQLFEFKPNSESSILRDWNVDTNLDNLMEQQVVAQTNSELTGADENAAQNSRDDSTAQFFKKHVSGRDVILSNLKRQRGNEPTEQTETSDTSSHGGSPPTVGLLDLENQRASNANILLSPFLPDIEDLRENTREAEIAAPRGQGSQNFKFMTYRIPGEAENATVPAANLNRKLQADESEHSAQNANKVINFNAQLTLDGIGGLTGYQVFDITNLPRFFNSSGIYTIESVTHDVSQDDWTTEIKAKFVVRNILNLEDGFGN